MAHHLIVLDQARDNAASYGITHKSRNVYQTRMGSAPTRLDVWSNTGRPNRDQGKQLGDELEVGDRNGNHVTEYSMRYTNGAWLDPMNEPTDEPVSLLLTPESSAICADTRFNTGQPGSGQVYDYETGKLARDDTATLVYPDGTKREITLHFPRGHNGHGFATFND